MADTGIVYLYADFVCLGRSNLNIFNREVLAGFPSDGGLGRVSV
jgi:hypothetical protein